MSHLLKILTAIDNDDKKSLLCEVPKDLIDGLNIQPDGTVDLASLLKICLRAKRQDSLQSKLKSKETAMNLIYNTSIAKEFNPKKQ